MGAEENKAVVRRHIVAQRYLGSAEEVAARCRMPVPVNQPGHSQRREDDVRRLIRWACRRQVVPVSERQALRNGHDVA